MYAIRSYYGPTRPRRGSPPSWSRPTASRLPSYTVCYTKLLRAYAERLDGGDLAGVGALFADATYRAMGVELEGAAAVAAAQARSVPSV